MDRFDWNKARGFVATAETGSLSAASRKLGLTQPTLSRQVAALEAELGVTLFDRVAKKLVLTDAGLDLLEHARKMSAAADAMALVAAGRSQSVEGSVSISASDGIAVHLLPPIIATMRKHAPQITVDVIVSNALSDLRRREADIAIRHVRPVEPELIGRHVREAEARFYVSKEWAAQNPLPRTQEDARGLSFVGSDNNEQYLQYLEGMGFPIADIKFPVSCGNSSVAWELVRQGQGVGAMMTDIASKLTDVVPVFDKVPSIKFPFWIVTHSELHTSKPIRTVFDILCEELKG